MIEFGDWAEEGGGDLGMADEGVAVEGFAGGVYEDDDDVVFDGAGGTERINENDVGFFVMLESVFGCVFERPIRAANNDFGVAFDFFAEEFGRDDVPTNGEADHAEAGFDDGGL